MKKTYLLKAVTFVMLALRAGTAFAGSELIWSDDKGAISADKCAVQKGPLNEMPIRVLFRIEKGVTGEELTISKSNKVMLRNQSIVSIQNAPQGLPYRHRLIRVISSPAASIGDSGNYATRNTNGIVREFNLLPASQFTFVINGSSAKVTGGFITKIGPKEVPLYGSKWTIAKEGGKAVYFVCPNQPNVRYYAFDVRAKQGGDVLLRVGVKGSETQIFSTAILDAESVKANTPQDPPWNMIIGYMVGKTETRDWFGDTESEVEAEDNDGDPAVDHEEDEEDNEPPAPSNLPDANGNISIPEGSSAFLICDSDGVNVRDDQISETPKFKSRPFERIFPKQSFGKPTTKQGVVKGKTYTFTQVQFVDRVETGKGQNVDGWIVKDFLSNEASCKSFQDSLKSVVCIADGKQQWVRDENNEELFKLGALEDIIRKSDWQTKKEQRVIDGKSYSFIPVIVPGHNMAPGWIAEDAILPDGECKDQREKTLSSAKGIDEADCCKFPVPYPAWYPYTKKEDTGKKWFGAQRSGRKHAGVDLFSKPGNTVFAVTAGTVTQAADTAFTTRYNKKRQVVAQSYDLAIKHNGGKIIRYGEISKAARRLVVGATVTPEEKLAVVSYTSMLHMEIYSGKQNGNLTVRQRDRKGLKCDKKSTNPVCVYQRREDVIDPTPYALRWEKETFHDFKREANK